MYTDSFGVQGSWNECKLFGFGKKGFAHAQRGVNGVSPLVTFDEQIK